MDYEIETVKWMVFVFFRRHPDENRRPAGTYLWMPVYTGMSAMA